MLFSLRGKKLRCMPAERNGNNKSYSQEVSKNSFTNVSVLNCAPLVV